MFTGNVERQFVYHLTKYFPSTYHDLLFTITIRKISNFMSGSFISQKILAPFLSSLRALFPNMKNIYRKSAAYCFGRKRVS